jgi:hypothetical protein
MSHNVGGIHVGTREGLTPARLAITDFSPWTRREALVVKLRGADAMVRRDA